MHSRCKVLVVEDNGIIAINTELSLIEMGYEVLPIAISGATVREILNDNKPDTVLMDINIFGPQDGIEVADEIYRLLRIPIIFYSGSSNEDTRKKALGIPDSIFLKKPATHAMLKNAIDSVLGTA